MSKLIPCKVSDEDLDKMMAAIAQDELYAKYKSLYTRAYVHVIMGQTKKGKQRTFDYSLFKLRTAMLTLESLKLEEFMQNVPEELLQKPVMYSVGRDKLKRRVMVIDWGRLTFKKKLIDANVKLAVACTMAYRLNEVEPLTLTISYAHTLKLGAKDIPTGYRLLRRLAKALLTCFPDGSCGQHHFVPKPLLPVVEFGKKLVPRRAVFKQKIGSYKWLKEELSKCCDNLEDILPEDLGGNSVRLEENAEFTLLKDGAYTSRVLEPANSEGRIVLVVAKGSDLNSTG